MFDLSFEGAGCSLTPLYLLLIFHFFQSLYLSKSIFASLAIFLAAGETFVSLLFFKDPKLFFLHELPLKVHHLLFHFLKLKLVLAFLA